jgi:glycosyltransferase involved in cell wall biosynthesis
MRICLYTNTALPKVGGQELVVDALGRQFTALGHRVVVLAPWQHKEGRFDPASVPYATAWHPRFFSTRWCVAWYGRWLAALHRRERFDVVHCHGVYPVGYVAASCKAIEGVALVVTSHGDDLPYQRKPHLNDRFRLALKRADAAVAIGRYTEDQYRTVCPDVGRVERIPNGVDLARFAEPAARPTELDPAIQPGRYFLFLGRLVERKGVDVLLRSFAEAARQCDLRLVVAGQGPARAALETLAAGLELGDRVCFVGRAEGDAKTYLLQNGLCTVVATRTWEAFPLVVLESYAAGRPVIGTRVHGLTDVIQSEQTGLLTPAEDVGALAEALLRAARQRKAVEWWGAEARRAAQQYDWRSIACRHVALFEDLIANRTHHAPS